MAKRVDPLKAKEAKQKKIAIGLGVLLARRRGLPGPEDAEDDEGPARRLWPKRPAGTPGRRRPAAPGHAPAPAADRGRRGRPTEPRARRLRLAVEAAERPAALVRAVLGQGPVRAAGRRDAIRALRPSGSGRRRAPPPDERLRAPSGRMTGSARRRTAIRRCVRPSDAPPVTPPAPATATTHLVNGSRDVVPPAAVPGRRPVFVLVSLAVDGKSVADRRRRRLLRNGEQTVKLRSASS